MTEIPLAWFNLAHAYLQDAAILNTAKPRKLGFYEEPVRFLYFHSIELFLKAYLRLKGLEDDELKSYGHNLTRLSDEAERRGLVITKRVRLVCEAARDFDDPMQTRYVKTGRKAMLLSTKLHEAARNLQTRVERELKGSGITLQPLPELPVVHPERGLTVAKVAKRLARSRWGVYKTLFKLLVSSHPARAHEPKSSQSIRAPGAPRLRRG